MKPSIPVLAALFGGLCLSVFVGTIDSESTSIRSVFILENIPALIAYTLPFSLPVGAVIWALLRGGWRAAGLTLGVAGVLLGALLWALGGNRALVGAEEIRNLVAFVVVVSIGLVLASALPVLLTARLRSRSTRS